MPHVNERWLQEQVVEESAKDIRAGLDLINGCEKPIITVMGSARVGLGDPFYDHCMTLCEALGKAGFAVLTGGGTGIMEAANRGASKAGAPSLAIRNGLLGREHPADEAPYTQLLVAEKLLFTRRFLLLTAASGLLIYPGGFGTDNEASEVLMLMQNDIVKRVPLLLMEDGEGFWTQNRERMRRTMVPRYIAETDLDLMRIRRIDDPGGVTMMTALLRGEAA